MTESIREVSPNESSRISEIGELTALAYLADGLVDQAHPYLLALRDAQARAESAHLLMMSDGEAGAGAIVGTLTVVAPGSPFIEVAGEDEFEFRMLAVSPIERGRGLGAKLTKAGMDFAVERGAKRIVLSTMAHMHPAHRLYERLGFERREDLDWVVIDHPDGSVSRIPAAEVAGAAGEANRGIQLIGYSWEPR
ncbi:GNAT family N-acetyltransferase [Demequina oxidasica]|uniref:GNAT family N-acetyltransferase n=1 Tax=Demequina oxidasica TaxID=676199 RepID=UPI000A00AAAE|nr:GNAT family N-acetyltransferase [Demequina oxidasica]